MAIVDARQLVAQPPRAWHVQGGDMQVDNAAARGPQAPFKLLLQVQGRTDLSLARQRLTLQAGQFTLIDGAEAVQAHADGWHEQWLVTLPRAGLLARHPHIQQQVGRPHDDAPEALLVKSFVQSLGAQTAQLGEAARTRGIAALMGLLGSLGCGGGGPSGAASDLLARARAWVEMDLADVDATSLAQHLRVSRRYLDKLFEAHGLSVSKYIWRRRLDLAAEALREGPHRPVVEVAYAVGFKDPSHFSRAFALHHGMTPKAWREAAEQGA